MRATHIHTAGLKPRRESKTPVGPRRVLVYISPPEEATVVPCTPTCFNTVIALARSDVNIPAVATTIVRARGEGLIAGGHSTDRSGQGVSAMSGTPPAADGSRKGDGTEQTRDAAYPGGECPICLSKEMENPIQTNCSHWFCARCILGYYEGVGRKRIKCPMCRHEVNMLHGSGIDVARPPQQQQQQQQRPQSADDGSPERAPSSASPSSSPPLPSDIAREIARFNQQNSGQRRTIRQVIEDAPLLLRRLWSDLREGDTRVLRALVRAGVMMQLFVVALYVISPVDLLPESLLGNLFGLVDDVLLGIVFIIHISIVYRAVLLSWERGRLAHATPNGGNRGAGGGIQEALSHSMQGAGVAAVGAVFGGMMASATGAWSWVAEATALAVGFVAAAAVARPLPVGRAPAVRVVDGDSGPGGDDSDGGDDGAAAAQSAMLNSAVVLD